MRHSQSENGTKNQSNENAENQTRLAPLDEKGSYFQAHGSGLELVIANKTCERGLEDSAKLEVETFGGFA